MLGFNSLPTRVSRDEMLNWAPMDNMFPNGEIMEYVLISSNQQIHQFVDIEHFFQVLYIFCLHKSFQKIMKTYTKT